MQGEGYEPNKLEKYADNVILAVRHQHTHIITAGYALYLFTATLTRHIRVLTLGGSLCRYVWCSPLLCTLLLSTWCTSCCDTVSLSLNSIQYKKGKYEIHVAHIDILCSCRHLFLHSCKACLHVCVFVIMCRFPISPWYFIYCQDSCFCPHLIFACLHYQR